MRIILYTLNKEIHI